MANRLTANTVAHAVMPALWPNGRSVTKTECPVKRPGIEIRKVAVAFSSGRERLRGRRWGVGIALAVARKLLEAVPPIDVGPEFGFPVSVDPRGEIGEIDR